MTGDPLKSVHNDFMKQASLVQARAHFSDVVDDAEYRGVTTVIYRHGKPSAAVVPMSVAKPKRKAKPRPLTPEEIAALHADLEQYDVPGFSAVQDTRDGRR